MVVLGCLALLAYVTAGPVKAKEEAAEKVDDSEELEAEEDDLEPEGGAHLGRYIGAGERDYDEYHGEEEAYHGKAGHEKAHKAGGAHSHYEKHEDRGYKSGKEEQGAHGLHNKKGHEEYDHHEEKEGHKGFKKEGEVYDKHGSDHKGKLEKNQHVKGEEEVSKHEGHGQAGGKVGSEFIKDKGHKTHGFKNVYHKEEYGEHKTFHDEHRESDHKKKYHDEHQDYTHHGGKHLKQNTNKGQYDENKHGHDFHKFGKAGQESNREGAYKKGGNHHTAGDAFKQEGGKHHSQAHAQGHHSEGVKKYHSGQRDEGHQHKAHHEAAHGHRGYAGHKKAAGLQAQGGYHGGHGDGYAGGYETVGDDHHVYYRRG